jgi:hypothetical protein
MDEWNQELRRPGFLTATCIVGIVSLSLSMIWSLSAVFSSVYGLIALLPAGFELLLWALVLARRNWARVTLTVLLSISLAGVVIGMISAAALADYLTGYVPSGFGMSIVAFTVLACLAGAGFLIFYLAGLNAASSRAWLAAKPSTAPVPESLPIAPPVADTVSELRDASRTTAKPFGVLIAEEGALRGTTSVLGHQDYVLGRSGDIVLPAGDLKISREHAKIRFENGAFVIYDMGSTNHTRVNGERVDRKLLQTGDRIGIGETVFRFEWVRK